MLKERYLVFKQKKKHPHFGLRSKSGVSSYPSGLVPRQWPSLSDSLLGDRGAMELDDRSDS
jgi:hypothetical protein